MPAKESNPAPLIDPKLAKIIFSDSLLRLFILFALFIRVYDLERKPVHHDEGVNGWFIEKIVKNWEYTYSKENYHGPTYFYFGAFSSIIYGKICKLLHCVGGLSIFSIRLVPAIFGTLICLSPLLLCEELGLLATLAVALLLAISPANVFYSRYAIHENTLCIFLFIFSSLILSVLFSKKEPGNFFLRGFLSPMRQRPRKPFSSKGQFFLWRSFWLS